MLTRMHRGPILRIIPAICWMAVIYYLSSRTTLPSPPGLSISISAIFGHIAIYAVLTLLLLYGFSGFIALRARDYFFVLLLATAYGVSDEIHQSFVPGRHATVFDVGMDFLGASILLISAYLIDHQRHP